MLKEVYLANYASENGATGLALTIEGILKFTKGDIPLAQRLILATKDAVEEVSTNDELTELAETLNLPRNPATHSLSLYKARV